MHIPVPELHMLEHSYSRILCHMSLMPHESVLVSMQLSQMSNGMRSITGCPKSLTATLEALDWTGVSWQLLESLKLERCLHGINKG